MGLPIHVEAYAGYRPDERPRRFELDGTEYRIYAWDREWRTPDYRFFIVRAGGKRYVLQHDEQSDSWSLLDKYDGTALFARPNLTIIAIDAAAIRTAQRRVLGCQHCHADEAVIPFDHLLGDLLSIPTSVQILMSVHAACPQCGNVITEETLVDYDCFFDVSG